jgi:hypothetical protein
MSSHGRRVQIASVVAAALLVVVATSACTSAPSTPVNSTASTSASPPASTSSAAGQTYASDRLGYRLRLPLNWGSRPGYLDWELGVAPTPGSPSVDTLSAPAGNPFILVARQQRPSGETLSEWLVQLQNAKSIVNPDLCTPPTAEADTSLGSEPAKSFSMHCPSGGPDAVGVQVLAMHGRLGYVLMCFDANWGATRIEELVKQCRDWSTSFTYLPA